MCTEYRLYHTHHLWLTQNTAVAGETAVHFAGLDKLNVGRDATVTMSGSRWVHSNSRQLRCLSNTKKGVWSGAP